MSWPDRSTRNPNPIYNPYARKLPSMYDHTGLLSDDDNDSDNNNQTFSSYYQPKPRPSRYGDVDGYGSDEYDDDNNDNDNNNYNNSNNTNNNNSTPLRHSARIAKKEPVSYVQLNSVGRQSNNNTNNTNNNNTNNNNTNNNNTNNNNTVTNSTPLRRSARIARKEQKFGVTSYVGMDSIEPECEGDFITDIWYDDSYDYDSDYESPEEIKARKEAEYEKKQILKQMKKQLRDAKKANDNMDMDIHLQIAEDIAKLSLDTTKLSDEEYYQILRIKQDSNLVLTWDELNFVTDYTISQMKQEPKAGSLHNMVSQMDKIKAKLPPAIQQCVSIQQVDKEIKDMVVTINMIENW